MPSVPGSVCMLRNGARRETLLVQGRIGSCGRAQCVVNGGGAWGVLSEAPRWNSSPAASSGSERFESRVNAACGYSFQISRSPAVIVSQPKVYMYRPGSVTRPTLSQVILSTLLLSP